VITPILLMAGAFATGSWLFSRWLQRFGIRPARPQAAAICYRWKQGEASGLEFLLVRTRNDRRWIFPKGNVETGETPAQAAVRETREEAGIDGRITGELATIEHRGDLVSLWLLEVDAESPAGRGERQWKWLAFKEAKAALKEHRSKERAAPLIDALVAAQRQLVLQQGGTPLTPPQ